MARDGSASHRVGLALVTGSAVAWSLAGFFTRLLALDTFTMLAWRGLFGAAGIAALLLVREGWGGVRAALRGLGAAGWGYAGLSALGMMLFIAALGRTTVAHVAVIYATVPFVAAALGWRLLGEAPSCGALLASLAALGGVAITAGFGAEGGALGDALAFGMTAVMGLMMVAARRQAAGSALTAAGLSALISGLACWPLGHPLAVDGPTLGLLALFGLVNSALGLALFTTGARLLPPVETALIGALDAPLAPLWVWAAFGETPGPATLAGGLLVFAAVGAHLARAGTGRPSTGQ